MKAIKNLKILVEQLEQVDPHWRRAVYERTGVIPIIHKNRAEITLFGACGYIDLLDDATFSYSNGIDLTEYCDINTVDELINYILEMDSYQKVLKDCSLGQFTKAELFWAVWSTLIMPIENQRRADGTCNQDWGLFQIEIYRGHIDLHLLLVDYNDGSVWLDYDVNQSLNEALEQIATKMNEITADIEEIPTYRVMFHKLKAPPETYDQLQRKLSPDGEFSWLQ